MVYCGRPAASCARCRARKRRCDKATPACGQCVRISNVCPGYSDPSVVRIRDETMRIIHRTKATNARRATSSSLSKSGQDHSPSRSTRFFDSSTPTTSSTPGASSLPQDVNSCRDNDCPSEANGTAPFEGQHRGDGKAKGRNAQRMCPAADSGHESGGMDLLACYGESQSGRSQARWALSPPSSSRLSVTLSVPASPAAPSTNLGLLGMNYFLANYVLPGSGPCPGSLNYSLDILSDPMEDTELVQEAIRAVGLAGVANITKADAIMYRARLSYAAALARVNAALADLVMVKSNSPLFAAMMLSIFETITCSSEVALKALRNHIDGMANLLILRGAEQFSTKPGSQLFGEALSHVLILQSRYGVCLSPRLRVLRVAMERQLPQRAPSWHLSTLHIDVMDLYHLVNPDKEAPFLPEEWEKLLSQAVELDQRLEKIFTLVPASWSFKTVHDPASDPRIVYRGIYHVYYNTWVAKVWDGMRACRIILHQAIHCLLLREGQAWAPHELEAERGTYANLLPASWRTTIELRNEILASVPQMLGFIGVDDAMGASQEGTSNGVAASGPYSLLWYLYLVGRLPFNSLETRSWIVDRLRAIRSATGIQKAVYLADTIENYSVLQSRAFSMHEFLIPEESANLIPN